MSDARPAVARDIASAALTWLIFASAHRLLLLALYHPGEKLGGLHTYARLGSARMTLFAFANGFATDLVSFTLFVLPFFAIAFAGSRSGPRLRALSRGAPWIGLGILTLAFPFDLLTEQRTGLALNAVLLRSFPFREYLGASLVAAVLLAATLPALFDFVLRDRMRAPVRGEVGAALVIGVLLPLYVLRGLIAGAPDSSREKLELAMLREYEDPAWRVASGELLQRPPKPVVLPPEEIAGLLALLLPGDDAIPTDAARPLLRTWHARGEPIVGISPPAHEKNVVVIFLEATSVTDLAPAAGESPLAPRFEAMAREGLLFTSFYSNATDSARGISATLSSLYPSTSAPPLLRDDLGEVLRTRGFTTSPIFSSLPAAASWVRDAKAPWLVVASTASHRFPFPAKSGARSEWERSRAALRTQDARLGELVDTLRSRPDFSETVFVVLGDHGSSIAPGGIRFFGGMREEAIHVPLLLWSPGWIPAKEIPVLGSQVDVAPTLLDLFGIDGVETSFAGVSLLRGGQGRVFSTSVALGEPLLALLRGDYKLVVRPGIPMAEAVRIGTDLAPPQGRIELVRAMVADAQRLHRASEWIQQRGVSPPAAE